MKKTWLVLILVLVGTLLLGSIIYLYLSTARINRDKSNLQSEINALRSQIVSKTVTATKTATATGVLSDEEQIKQALALKHSRDVSEVRMTVSTKEGDYVSGSVTFGDEPSGGWFLAVKKDESWLIVDDGNGVIECLVIEPYSFPATVVPECYDTETGQTRTR